MKNQVIKNILCLIKIKTAFIVLYFLIPVNSKAQNKIVYIDPKPEAEFVNIYNNITIGFENRVNLNTDAILRSINVTGAKSSHHYGKIIFCGDNKKIIFAPDTPFEKGEKVDVKITGEFLRYFSSVNTVFKFSFNTSAFISIINPDKIETRDTVIPENMLQPAPMLNVTINNNPSDGYLFLAPYLGKTYLVITDKNGISVWNTIQQNFAGDFKIQPGGNFTYFDGFFDRHYELNQNFNKTDSFYCGNGYVTDIHELRLLTNDNALVMAYDTQVVNMSGIIQGGDSNALVIGTIIQEVDPNHNVVFQWRSWDHFAITDALHENLKAHVIDAVHGNSIDIDNDGNLLLSSRHLDEITKINSVTGDIIWRFGGLNNQFTFINDPIHFNYQHAARRIANGNITIYDNGNFHTPPSSRAVEYQLDEQNKTATLVWQYKNVPNIFGSWGGYVQRLNNGNTLISWGGTRPTVTEVTPQGSIVFEASYPVGFYTYRAYKFDVDSLPISVSGNNTSLPRSFNLEQNYPNPFNPKTIINYQLPISSYVKLVIYDVIGREIAILVDQKQNAGKYDVEWDAVNYPSGIYFYKLTVTGASEESYSDTKKMVLLK